MMKPTKHDQLYTISSIFLLIVVFSTTSIASAGDGFVLDRFRLTPRLSVSEEFTDNVFLNDNDVQKAYIFSVQPELNLDLALFPKNILSLEYSGDYREHSGFDNFRNYQHQGGMSWSWTTPKGSEMGVGTMVRDLAIQPFSEQDRAKDFITGEAFANLSLKLWAHTQTRFSYTHTRRRFDNDRDETDNFDRDGVTINLQYSRFQRAPLLIEYRYARQDNQDLSGFSTDSEAHTILFGFQWAPTAKLSGVMTLGYSHTDFEDGEDFVGIVTDTDLTYSYSDITKFKLTAKREVVASTRAARETGDSFVSSSVKLTVIHHRWDPFIVSLDVTYQNDDFSDQTSPGEDRQDDLIQTGFQAQYFIRHWLSFRLAYQHSSNSSNFSSVDYKENKFTVGVSSSF